MRYKIRFVIVLTTSKWLLICLPIKIRYKTKEPLWEDCFSFLVHNPRRQELEVEVTLQNVTDNICFLYKIVR